MPLPGITLLQSREHVSLPRGAVAAGTAACRWKGSHQSPSVPSHFRFASAVAFSAAPLPLPAALPPASSAVPAADAPLPAPARGRACGRADCSSGR